MDQVIYADLNLHKNSCLESSFPPSLSQNICQGPCGHQFALKFSCVLIIILILSGIGFSISVMLKQNSSMEKHMGTHVPDNWKNTTVGPTLLTCTEPWKQQGYKCLIVSFSSNTWNDSQLDCSIKRSRLLLIQDQNELKEILKNIKDDAKLFWVGLKFSLSEKKWKWINGSFLNPKGLQVHGDAIENSCVSVSSTQVYSENCDAENGWICQKELERVSNKVFSNS